jgi:hypothetical protein
MPLDKKVRKLLSRCLRQEINPDENAGYRGVLDRCWEDGKIGVAVSGMDCDCSAYRRQYTIEVPNSVQALKRWYEDHVSSLDGPESLNFIHPSKVDKTKNESRDLALEAWEDGHPHVVYMPSW